MIQQQQQQTSQWVLTSVQFNLVLSSSWLREVKVYGTLQDQEPIWVRKHSDFKFESKQD